MRNGLKQNLKDYFWNSVKTITKSFSLLKVDNLDNGYVKCFWQISNIDNLRIDLSKSCFYAIRIFDITNNRNIKNSTCIMKEVQVSKFQSYMLFPIPINKGVYYFEFGYRKRNGDWRKLADNYLNLGFRIIKSLQKFDNDNWFHSQNSINSSFSKHDESYKLSLQDPIGGSENIFDTQGKI